MFLAPPRADVVASITKRSATFLPAIGFEIWLVPTISLFSLCVLTLPSCLVAHRGDGFQHLVLFVAHKAVGSAIHAQQSFQRFLVACPKTCVAFG